METNETGMAASIRALNPGQTYSKSIRIPLGSKTMKRDFYNVRNSVNQTVARIRKETGSYFESTSGTFITDDLSFVIATVAITRVEDGLDI